MFYMGNEMRRDTGFMRMKLSNYVASRLVEEGIRQVFTVTGGGAMHLNDAWDIRKDFTASITIMSRPAPLLRRHMPEFTTV